jgi:hypothetical protein
MFKPRTVTERFAKQFPQGLTLRPLSLRASAEETAMMLPSAAALQARYKEITVPTFIIAGLADQTNSGRASSTARGSLQEKGRI